MSAPVRSTEERNERQCIGRVGKQSEVYEKLVFSTCLHIISGLGLPVLHGVFLHTHECGIRISLVIGITFSKSVKMIVVFHPVSYTHLDVYKRQPRSAAIVSGDLGLIHKVFAMKGYLLYIVVRLETHT